MTVFNNFASLGRRYFLSEYDVTQKNSYGDESVFAQRNALGDYRDMVGLTGLVAGAIGIAGALYTKNIYPTSFSGVCLGTSALCLASFYTAKVGYIAVLAISMGLGTTFAFVDAVKDGRVFIKIDIVEIIKAIRDVLQKGNTNAPVVSSVHTHI